MSRAVLLSSALFAVAACTAETSKSSDPLPDAPTPGFVSAATKTSNMALAKRLPLSNQQDFEDASPR